MECWLGCIRDSEDLSLSGYPKGMRLARAQLLPEEVAAGSDDPGAQAEAILEESQDRTLHPEQTR